MRRKRLLLGVLALAVAALIVFKPHRHQAIAVGPADSAAEPAGLAPQPIHDVRSEDFGGGNRYLVRNLLAGPIEVQCRLDAVDNVRSDPPLPRSLVLAARAEQEVAELHKIDPARSSHALVKCSAMVGDPHAVPVGFASYALPFHPGTAFTLDQGFNDAFSHNDAESRYALDLGVPEGTPVLAARDGVVMQVEEDFRGGGADAERYGDRANFVRIVHADGSMALYAHLALHSALHRPGDSVRAGEIIGKSGMTGYTTGPHLHFTVQKNVGMDLQSIPFTMPGVDPYHSR